ncbi:hypothetical protein GCM10009577_52220 [Streptomyces javensis]
MTRVAWWCQPVQERVPLGNTILDVTCKLFRRNPVPFGNSSLLLAGGLARHHRLLEPCPVIVSLVYQMTRKLLRVPAVLLRRDIAGAGKSSTQVRA